MTCNVAHMKRVTHQFKKYCGTQSQQKVCTGHRCVTVTTELDHEQTQKTYTQIIQRKIPKISPGAYIFQRSFLRGLFLEGLIFGGAYFRNFTVTHPMAPALICSSNSSATPLDLEVFPFPKGIKQQAISNTCGIQLI